MTNIGKLIDNYIDRLQEQEQQRNITQDKFPSGWDENSVKQFIKTLTYDTGINPIESRSKWFYSCVEKIKGSLEESDPDSFCSLVLDSIEDDPTWLD